jgi:hypothetical protein
MSCLSQEEIKEALFGLVANKLGTKANAEKEEGKRKGRGEKIERDARRSRVPRVCGTCASVTRVQRTVDATVTLPRRTEASFKKKKLDKMTKQVRGVYDEGTKSNRYNKIIYGSSYCTNKTNWIC